MARFRGKDKTGDFIDNQRFSGNAFQIIRAADTFAARHLPIASHFEPGQIKRIDQPAVPNRALREALILKNVWCGQCASTCTISAPVATIVGRSIVLNGNCATCGEKVARYIEES